MTDEMLIAFIKEESDRLIEKELEEIRKYIKTKNEKEVYDIFRKIYEVDRKTAERLITDEDGELNEFNDFVVHCIYVANDVKESDEKSEEKKEEVESKNA